MIRLGIAGSGAIALGLAKAATAHGETVVWARGKASAERARDRIEGAGTVVAVLFELSGCDVVVEAVAEDPQVKADLHRRLGQTLPEDAVLATTTSSLSVAELAEASGRPDRFGGLHVFNPVEKMQLVELAFPGAASERTRARLHQLCEELGKTAVEVPDAAGFVVNRLLFPYLFDAVRLVEDNGLDAEAVDTCMRLGAGHPMGPLALLDFVGLEVPERVRELIGEGRLGRKSSAGFYDY